MNYDFRAAPKDTHSLAYALSEIEDAQLIRRDENEPAYFFKHALVQDSAYNSLMRQDRRRLHRIVAQVLERAFPEQAQELAPRLAEHWDEAGETERALFYFQRAAEDAAARFANREALSFYSKALDAAEELQTDTRDSLYRARGVVYERIGEFDRARADLERAWKIAHQEGDLLAEWQSLVDLGFAWTASDYARAGEYFERALDLARASDEPLRVAQTLNRVGNWYLNNEDPERALAYHREALSIFQASNHLQGIAETEDLLGMTNLLGSDMLAAREHFTKATALFQQQGDTRGYISSLTTNYLFGVSTQGETVVLPPPLGDKEDGLAEILKVTRQIGWRAGEAFGLWTMAEGFIAEGKYQRAFELLDSAIQIAREIDHRQWLTAATRVLGMAELNLLDFENARTHLENALALANEIGSRLWLHSIGGLLASTYIAQGELAATEKILRENLPPHTVARTLAQRDLWAARVELALARHEPERALELLERLIQEAFNLTTGKVIPHLWTLRAQAYLQQNRASAAQEDAISAADAAQRMGQPPLQWRAVAVLAHAYRAQQRDEDAERAANAAEQIVNELANSLADSALREKFLTRALLQIRTS